MREILFKAKRTDTGDWAEGLLCKRPSAIQIGEPSPWWIHVPPVDPDDKGGMFNVDPETVCQYTGLTDKNGKKIFEGDTMAFDAYGRNYSGFVEFVNGSFGVNCEAAQPFLDDAIIKHGAVFTGNIHDKQDIKGGE